MAPGVVGSTPTTHPRTSWLAEPTPNGCKLLNNGNKVSRTGCRLLAGGPLAQSVEHRTFNPGVTGSNPVRLTIR